MARNVTSMSVDPDFFDKIFEPARRKFEKELNIKLSQAKFTKLLARRGATFKLPKQKIINNKFKFNPMVRKRKGKKLNFNLF